MKKEYEELQESITGLVEKLWDKKDNGRLTEDQEEIFNLLYEIESSLSGLDIED